MMTRFSNIVKMTISAAALTTCVIFFVAAVLQNASLEDQWLPTAALPKITELAMEPQTSPHKEFDSIHKDVAEPSENLRKSNVFECPKKHHERWIVITSINYPTPSIRSVVENLQNWMVIVIADTKTPLDYFRNDSALAFASNFILLTTEQQLKLDFELISLLPFSNYARKNIGYLCAIKCGAEVIYETDDDNAPKDRVIPIFPPILDARTIIDFTSPKGALNLPFANPYAVFGQPAIWPRGYPEWGTRADEKVDYVNLRRRKDSESIRPWIQQGLADLDPDVDAFFRLTYTQLIGKIRFDPFPSAVALAKEVYAPYNTQNTVYLKQAFWGLLIPHSTTFRVCDIWRGYWVQRLLKETEGDIIFLPPTVEQIRNPHNLTNDYEEERDIYDKTINLVNFLVRWRAPPQMDLFERMIHLAAAMADRGFWKVAEVELMRAWTRDLKRLGYSPPAIGPRSYSKLKEPQSGSGPLKKKPLPNSALCLTGSLPETFAEAWPEIRSALSNYSKTFKRSDVEVFWYLSVGPKSNQADKLFLNRETLFNISSTVSGTLYNETELLAALDGNSTLHLNGSVSLSAEERVDSYTTRRCFELIREHSANTETVYHYFAHLPAKSIGSFGTGQDIVFRTFPTNWR